MNEYQAIELHWRLVMDLAVQLRHQIRQRQLHYRCNYLRSPSRVVIWRRKGGGHICTIWLKEFTNWYVSWWDDHKDDIQLADPNYLDRICERL